MVEAWTETLRCVKCGKNGIARLCQAECADPPTVASVSDGFKILQTRRWPDFQCEKCGIAVAP
jgi:hypothetical protein